jgi:hypothetical protein
MLVASGPMAATLKGGYDMHTLTANRGKVKSGTWCRICGADGAKYQPRKRQALCAWCYGSTPNKLSRAEFDRRYWGSEWEGTPESIRREFYSDYLASSCTFTAYVKHTCEGRVA